MARSERYLACSSRLRGKHLTTNVAEHCERANVSDSALRRTTRRCTAVLVLALATVMVILQKFMGRQGIPTDSNPLPEIFVATASLYPVGSIGWSLFGADE